MRRGMLIVALIVLAMPATAAAARLESFDLPSPLVASDSPGSELADGRTVPKVNVLLPDGYDARKRYPVLWLLHGAAGGTDNWLPGIKELAKGMRAILVMPDAGTIGMYMDWFNGGTRGAPAWTRFHLGRFKRTIERRYPIRKARRWHAIAGISMGGQGTWRNAAMLPGYFGSAASFSGALPDMQSTEAQGGLGLIAAANGDPEATYEQIFGPASEPWAEGNSPLALAANYTHTRMYLTSGNGVNCPGDPVNPQSIAIDITVETALNRQQGPFAQAIEQAGGDVTAVTTCGVHTFGVWDRAFAAARAWGFFRPVPDHPTSWTYRTVHRTADAWGLKLRFEQQPQEVATFVRAGRTLSGDGAGKVRVCGLKLTLPFKRRLPAGC